MTKHIGAVLVAASALIGSAVQAGTLDDIRKNGVLRIAYREDAPPFSYKKDGVVAPVGFMVDLCRAVADGLAKEIGMANLKVAYVPVTSSNRFDAIMGDKADLLCEATTATLRRRQSLGFSIATFVDGASFIIRSNGPKDIGAMAGQKVAVLAGTTTEEDVRRAFVAAKVDANITLMQTHQEGLDAVEKGTVVAYFADRAILTSLLQSGGRPAGTLALADTYLSIEPYALAMKRGDEDFRLAVDTQLSRIYRSGEIAKLFAATFGPARPSPMLLGLFTTSALPQ
ncbi:MAG: amino acid ABC transporter substrate-binding protein [Enhydrobacter sp.]|nr:amino acid ABC transporter substrate-binding protein [Enhydrobacter sp.]